MPRVRDGDSTSFDYCLYCFPDEKTALEWHGNGPAYEHGADHPLYESGRYHCATCNKQLTADDD